MKYRVKHITNYDYPVAVNQCYNEVKILPRSTSYQDCASAELKVYPNPNDQRERLDYFGNRALYFAIQYPHRRLSVSVISEVIIQPSAFFTALKCEDTWESIVSKLREFSSPNDIEAYQFTLESPLITPSEALRNYTGRSFKKNQPCIQAIMDFTHTVFTEFAFDPEFTTTTTPLDEVMKHKRGVCQDFAHLAIAGLRSLGLAARYVSGYIETKPPPGKEKLVGADASHAWFSVYIPKFGWIDFDPTNNLVPKGQHITVAWGRDYSDVTPLKGVIYGGGEHKLTVSVDVTRTGDQ